ncbi:triphosphatase [Oxalobacteraceae bacterium GrIS 2.11]
MIADEIQQSDTGFHSIRKPTIMRIKLTFHLEANAIAATLKHPLLKKHAVMAASETALREVYFDSPDGVIQRANANLSVQSNHLVQVQSLQIGDEQNSQNFSGGLQQWRSWQFKLPDHQPDLGLLKSLTKNKTGYQKLLREIITLKALHEVFQTRFNRYAIMLQLPEDTDVACSLEHGQISSGDQSRQFCILDFELLSGSMIQLIQFTLALMKTTPLHVGHLCKIEQGYALHDRLPVSAVTATELSLTPQLPVEEAVRRIIHSCMTQIQSNQAGIREPWNPECLHQMRVGFRRLRSTFWLLKKIQPLPDDFEEEMEWLDTQLGQARDWDVFHASTLPQLINLTDSNKTNKTTLQDLHRLAADRMRLAHREVCAALVTPRYARIVLGLLRWQCELVEQLRRDPNQSDLIEFSDQALKKSQQRLLRRSKQISDLEPKSLHQLRVTVKKIRYMADFFKALYPPGKIQHYIDTIARLQDCLGQSNDRIVAGRLIQTILADHPELDAGFINALFAAHFDTNKTHIPRLLKALMQISLKELLSGH